MQGFDYRKAVQSLNYLAEKEGGDLNKMKAIKLLWLADRLHLRRYGRPIIHDEYYAMKYGPVQSSVRDLTHEHQEYMASEEMEYRNEFLVPEGHNIKSIKGTDTEFFSETDIGVLEEIYLEFGKLDQFNLADLSHRYPEWKKFEEQINHKESSRYLMSMNDFFQNPQDDAVDFFATDPEQLQLSREVFEESQNSC